MNDYVTPELLAKLCKSSSCMELSNDKVKKTIKLISGYVVITGTMSSGALGWICCWGNYVVPKDLYKGNLKPLFERDHYCEVQDGLRDRGYEGRMFKHEGKIYVMEGPQITFHPLKINQSQQLELF